MRRWSPPAVVVALTAARCLAAAEPDYRGYEALLQDRLAVMRIDGRPAATAIDYVGLYRKPGAEAGLKLVRAQLLSAPPNRMSAAERKAWAINLYNFLVIERVLEHFRVAGEPPMTVRLLRGFFDDPVVQVNGTWYSLDSFERHFLFADFDRKRGAAPPRSLDPRVHFAIVCAARGCPPLARRPYRAATIDAELDRTTREALLSPAHLRLSPGAPRWSISSIFDWYAADFGGRRGVIEFLKRYAPKPAADRIARHGEEAIGDFISWDWKLNQVGEDFRGSP